MLLAVFQKLILKKKTWHPEFKSEKTHPLRMSEMNLSDFLSQDVPYITLNKECKVSEVFFYFRVNNLGKVDSVHYDHGVISEDITTKIVDNINKTAGHWKMPPGSKSTDFCWFIYPFIDLGIGAECQGNEETLRWNLTRILLLLDKLNPITETKDKDFFIIAPTLRGSAFQRE